MQRSLFSRFLTITLAGAAMMPLLFGQSDSGRITGTVTDATNAVVPNATVTIKNEKTGQSRKVMANEQGVYLVTQLGPSTYTVLTEVTGFAPAQFSGVRDHIHIAESQVKQQRNDTRISRAVG